jgi:uncharacterized protein YicC (UPF0701 family)
VPLTDSCAAANSISNRAAFAQKENVTGHFSVIFEKLSVAFEAQNICVKSPTIQVEFEIKRSSQQHYRRSRVHLSLQIDQEATEMEKCDEEILVAYGWFSSIRHSRSRVGR